MLALRTVTAACMALAVLVITACKPQPAGEKPPAPVEHKNPVRLGLFLPLSGSQSSFGEDAIRGAQLAADQINERGGIAGRPVSLEVRDTHSNETTTAEVVRELAANKSVNVIVGEIVSARSIVAAKIAQESGIPMISPASTHQDVTAAGDMIFRICYAEPFQGAAMARFASSLKVSKAAILLESGNPYSLGLADSFRENFTKSGGTIVAEQSFRAGDLSFRPQLETIKAAQPEVIFLPSYYQEAALVIREARQLGLEIPFLGGDGWDSLEFLRAAGAAADNCYSANHFSGENLLPQNEAFVAAYKAKFQSLPPPLAALAFDAVSLAADAITRAGADDRSKIRDAIAATSVFPGATGTLTFDTNRNPAKPAVILRVENGAFTYLETIVP
jgi:branched-chain amino acid transport system substrate-binding protein